MTMAKKKIPSKKQSEKVFTANKAHNLGQNNIKKKKKKPLSKNLIDKHLEQSSVVKKNGVTKVTKDIKPVIPKDKVKNKSNQVAKTTTENLKPAHVKKREKRLKWKQKQMEKKLKRIEEKEKKVNDGGALRQLPPKSAKEVSSNWKQLLGNMTKATGSEKDIKGEKRKKSQKRIRNPKLRKTEEPPKIEAEKESSDAEIWFDDVDEILLDRKIKPKPATSTEPQPKSAPKPAEKLQKDTSPAVEKNPLVKDDAFKGLTKVVGMDCEMVGVGDGTEDVLARVSIVNQFGVPVYDTFVKPKEKVVDYRTHVSGVRPEDLKNAETFEKVQKDVCEILNKRILVGHAIMNDLKVLYIGHPRKSIRDTSKFRKFRQLFGGKTPSLKKLSEKVLAVPIQQAEHNSIQDAQAAMRLYTMYRKEWDKDLKEKKMARKKKGGMQKQT